jgi:hypothetical protein
MSDDENNKSISKDRLSLNKIKSNRNSLGNDKRKKKVINAFMLYCKEQNKKLLEEGKKITLKILGENWESETNKEYYFQLYNEKKKQFEEDLKNKKRKSLSKNKRLSKSSKENNDFKRKEI